MDADLVSIPARFNGPPASGNGGYSCGVLGSIIGDCAEVTLRKPPPLDTEMRVTRDDGEWTLFDGHSIVATGHASTLDLEIPEPPSYARAEAAEADYLGHVGHIFPTCFVCGPDRSHGDGLRLFTGKVGERDIVASHWLPTPDVAGEFGEVAARVVWGALDCPTYFGGVTAGYAEHAVLGRLTAKIVAAIVVGKPHVVIGWPLEDDEKRWHGGSAIFTAGGELCAFARGTWVQIGRTFPGVSI
ncbi:MAG: hypothetical protein Q7R41_00645 [Phycisphaerales bacterium]|nr:hypothetical protein [Phycisphaerales bacterium]